MLADVNVMCEQLSFKTKNITVSMLLQKIGAHRVNTKIIAAWKALFIRNAHTCFEGPT